MDREVSAYGDNNHGAWVLSNMAGYIDQQYVGTAPDASYYLFRTEDAGSENPVEESYWVEAAERADSLGVHIINSSLGYVGYDNTAYSHTYQDMDGQTTFVSRGASLAVEKGILVVTSNGNSGSSATYPYMGAPSDGINVFSIGAVNAAGNYASFSSQGYTFDGRVNPDVVAQGEQAAVIGVNRGIGSLNGTSFSGPIIAGAVASIWQADPSLTNLEIMQIVRESASQFTMPDAMLGYGIPNFNNALGQVLSIENQQVAPGIVVYPNPVKDFLRFSLVQNESEIQIQIFNTLGQQVVNKTIEGDRINLQELATGLYYVQVTSSFFTKTFKIQKN